jgi:hypothetical protein
MARRAMARALDEAGEVTRSAEKVSPAREVVATTGYATTLLSSSGITSPVALRRRGRHRQRRKRRMASPPPPPSIAPSSCANVFDEMSDEPEELSEIAEGKTVGGEADMEVVAVGGGESILSNFGDETVCPRVINWERTYTERSRRRASSLHSS